MILYRDIYTFYNFLGGLTCVCDDCLDGMCTVPEGGKCYSQVFKVDGQESRRRRCYESSYLHFCDTVNSMVVIECCATDYCNGLLYPTLPEITTTPTETPPLTETPPPSETREWTNSSNVLTMCSVIIIRQDLFTA